MERRPARPELQYLSYLYGSRDYAVSQLLFLVVPAVVMALGFGATIYGVYSERLDNNAMAALIAVVATFLAVFLNAMSWATRPGLVLLHKFQESFVGRWILFGLTVAVNVYVGSVLYAAWSGSFLGAPGTLRPLLLLLSAVGVFLGAVFPGIVAGWHLPLAWIYYRLAEFIEADALEEALAAMKEFYADKTALVVSLVQKEKLTDAEHRGLTAVGQRMLTQLGSLEKQVYKNLRLSQPKTAQLTDTAGSTRQLTTLFKED